MKPALIFIYSALSYANAEWDKVKHAHKWQKQQQPLD